MSIEVDCERHARADRRTFSEQSPALGVARGMARAWVSVLLFLFLLLLHACAAPPADSPPLGPVPPALRASTTLSWLPRARAPGLGAGFVLADMASGGPAVHYVTAGDFAPTLATVWPWQLAPDLADCPACVVGDFDGDGPAEVLGKVGSDLIVFPLTGEPRSFVTRRASLLDDGSDGPWLSGRACDWNGDGRADLAIAREQDVLVLTDVLAGRWTGQVLCRLPTSPTPAPVVATCGDWDRDGLPDLVLALPDAGLLWCRNDGTATVPRLGQPRPLWPSSPGRLVTTLQLHDVDRDGWLDVVVGEASPGPSGFTLRVPRSDRNGIEEQELADAERRLRTLLQERRRAAVGFDEDAPTGPVLGNSAWPHPPMPAHERELRDRIAALESRPIALVGLAHRVLLRGK